jgi:hypothetical protein
MPKAKKANLVTPLEIQQFVRQRQGQTINLVQASGLVLSIEAYVLRQAAKQEEIAAPPYIYQTSRCLSNLAKEWLADHRDGENTYDLLLVAPDWVGKRLTKHETKGKANYGWEDHDSYVFLRREMWKSPTQPCDSADLLLAFELSQSPKHPKECYPLSALRDNISRYIVPRKTKRVRIPKNAAIRESQPFQAVHLPDDTGCHSVLMDEPHAMKTFFRGDQGDISFWWSEDESLWILWTDWVKWLVRFK